MKTLFRIRFFGPQSDNRKLAGILAVVVTTALSGVAAQAQQATKISRLGLLLTGTPSSSSGSLEAFRNSLRKLGYIEGKNILIEYRYAEGKPDRLPDLAAELVRLKVNIIVATVTPAAMAAKKATQTIPIIAVTTADPVGSRLVASLAHPGG